MSEPVQVVIPGLDAWFDGERWRHDAPPATSPVAKDPDPEPDPPATSPVAESHGYWHWIQHYPSQGATYGRYCYQKKSEGGEGTAPTIRKVHIPGGSISKASYQVSEKFVSMWMRMGWDPRDIHKSIKMMSAIKVGDARP